MLCLLLAAIGHILRPEFREEVSRIVGYALICERHNLLVEIAETNDPRVVKVTSYSERRIRNKSAYPLPLKGYAAIDEWGYDGVGKSEIFDCVMEIGGETIAPTSKPVADEFAVQVSTAEKSLNPDQVAMLRSRRVEYKNINDINFYHFTIPTVDPEIEVRAFDGLGVSIGFGTPTQNIETSRYSLRKRLVGTYFPHQNMSVRWWPKAQTRAPSPHNLPEQQ